MSRSSDTLQFSFPAHGDSVLSKMNALREGQRFCDITLLLGGSQGATVRPLYFHGHRVVLAASSDFLRDQFLLHEGRAELSVGVVSSVEVGERLLLSCYTGLLEVQRSLFLLWECNPKSIPVIKYFAAAALCNQDEITAKHSKR